MYDNQKAASPQHGTIYVQGGRSGTKYYQNVSAKWWSEFFYNPLDMPNYITVEVKAEFLTVEAFKQNGERIERWSIDKSRLKAV